MSETYEIACYDCKITLWIGQKDYIYTGEPNCMAALTAFFFAHQGHTLKFESTTWTPAEFEEIEY